jgi:hypothetical protein
MIICRAEADLFFRLTHFSPWTKVCLAVNITCVLKCNNIFCKVIVYDPLSLPNVNVFFCNQGIFPGSKMSFWMFSRPEMSPKAISLRGKKRLSEGGSPLFLRFSSKSKQTDISLCGMQSTDPIALLVNNHRTLSPQIRVSGSLPVIPKSLHSQNQTRLCHNFHVKIDFAGSVS